MLKYVIKRISLMLLTFFTIMTICFIMIRLIEPNYAAGSAGEKEKAIREALGYNRPILVQYGIFLKNIITEWNWGYSFKIRYLQPVGTIIKELLPASILLNVYSIIVSLPIGIALGIFAALKKNKWQDHVISVFVMLFISIPGYAVAFALQYFLSYKTKEFFPMFVRSLSEAGGWFTPAMTWSYVLPVMAASFGLIASLTRNTRAELTEALTSEYMLLARSKGLTRGQATVRHALKNAMVPILPGILGLFVGILGGSLIYERIFGVPGIGNLFLLSINLLDYNVFITVGMFYTFIGLAAAIVVDLSYGFLDPSIRMGARKK